MIPSVLARIEDVAIATTLNAIRFEGKIDNSDLATALTTCSAERGHDYERLEFLGQSHLGLLHVRGELNETAGDTILKFLVSAWLFVYFPTSVGVNMSNAMAKERNRLVSNVVLLAIMRQSGIPQYIRSNPIATGELYLPPGFRLPQGGPEDKLSGGKQELPVESDTNLPG